MKHTNISIDKYSFFYILNTDTLAQLKVKFYLSIINLEKKEMFSYCNRLDNMPVSS